MNAHERLLDVAVLGIVALMVAGGLILVWPQAGEASGECMKRAEDVNASLVREQVTDPKLRVDLVAAEDLCEQGKKEEANRILAQIERKIGSSLE